MSNDSPVSLAEARRRKEREAHRDLVLHAFDDFEHADKTEHRELAAAVNQEAREKL